MFDILKKSLEGWLSREGLKKYLRRGGKDGILK
jgi:hypothetical protein